MAAPLRVGVLNDMSAGPPGPADVEKWLRLGADELIDNARIDRDVEFVHAWGLGLPAGTAAAVERAYTTLVEQDVLLIVGPAIGDNALFLQAEAEVLGLRVVATASVAPLAENATAEVDAVL